MSYNERLQQNNTELNNILDDINSLPNAPTPNPPAVYQNLKVTENGTYTAGAGYDAIGQVEVEVAGGPQVSIKTITYEIGPRTDFSDDQYAVTYIDPYTLTLTQKFFETEGETGAFEILGTGMLVWYDGLSICSGPIEPYDKDTGELINHFFESLDNQHLSMYANIHLKIGKF